MNNKVAPISIVNMNKSAKTLFTFTEETFKNFTFLCSDTMYTDILKIDEI